MCVLENVVSDYFHWPGDKRRCSRSRIQFRAWTKDSICAWEQLRAFVVFRIGREAWDLVDSQQFLVRQRRTRVWGASILDFGYAKQEEDMAKFRGHLNCFKTNCHFPMEDCFLQDRPKQKPKAGREAALLEEALRKAHEASSRHT